MKFKVARRFLPASLPFPRPSIVSSALRSLMANPRMIYLRSVFIVFFLLMAQLTFAARVRLMRDAMMNTPSKRDLLGPNANIGRDLKTNAARMAAGLPPLPPRSFYPSRAQGMSELQWSALKC